MVAFAAPNSCSPPEFSEPDQSNPAQVNNQTNIKFKTKVLFIFISTHQYKYGFNKKYATAMLATCQDFWSHRNCNSDHNLKSKVSLSIKSIEPTRMQNN